MKWENRQTESRSGSCRQKFQRSPIASTSGSSIPDKIERRKTDNPQVVTNRDAPAQKWDIKWDKKPIFEM